MIRLKAVIQGAVQGVGFRPFVYRLAIELKVDGWVINSSAGVHLEIEGDRSVLDIFAKRLQREKPVQAVIEIFNLTWLKPLGYSGFEIRTSDGDGPKTVFVLPDVATCEKCLEEVFDSSDRRYLYPFTNCTDCGPRFSIIQGLPYDRPFTTMSGFPMCEDCLEEYKNPLDRRFHAQPNACPTCGPSVALWDSKGNELAFGHRALLLAASEIRIGKIIALKGLGGFQLIARADQDQVVKQLRVRKHRKSKPFALMVPSIEAAESLCVLSSQERSLLTSSQTPIVLLKKRSQPLVSEWVAPSNPNLGIMLPYTPLHHILARELNIPLVATSGNRAGEPICTDERVSLEQLKGLSDFFLVHNRPIAKHVDDSVVRIIGGRECLLRRARGYAPFPVTLKQEHPPILAVGGQLKNTIATTVGNRAFVSQYIGDLETVAATQCLTKTVNDFQNLYDVEPVGIACDLHPDYRSGIYARKRVREATSQTELIQVQHHYAHILSCMAEHGLSGPVLGVAWDGTGAGPDGTIWGGEFLLIPDPEERSDSGREKSFKRVAHMRTFCLPGGAAAIKEPRRAAFGLLSELGIERDLGFTVQERAVLCSLIEKKINSPETSSVGRLFDLFSALLGLRYQVDFEGQAAMDLEFAAQGPGFSYPFELHSPQKRDDPVIIDWEPMVLKILEDQSLGLSLGELAANIHSTFCHMILKVALRVNCKNVVLSGGCFQNKLLTEMTIKILSQENFRPFWHKLIPPNDGGISLGQLVAAGFIMSGKNR